MRALAPDPVLSPPVGQRAPCNRRIYVPVGAANWRPDGEASKAYHKSARKLRAPVATDSFEASAAPHVNGQSRRFLADRLDEAAFGADIGRDAPVGIISVPAISDRDGGACSEGGWFGDRHGDLRSVSYFLSFALHGLVLATALSAISDHKYEAPAGGAPIEVDLVVGFVDRAAMHAGVTEPADEAARPDEEQATPLDENVAPQTAEEITQPLETPHTPKEDAPAVEDAQTPPPTSAPVAEIRPPLAQSEEVLPVAEAKPKNDQHVDAAQDVSEPIPTPPKKPKAAPPPKPRPKVEARPVVKPRKVVSQKPKAKRAAPQGSGAASSRASSRGGSGGKTDFAGQAKSANHRTMILAHLARHKVYPTSARSQGIQGRVTVTFTVSAEGAVSRVSITKSSGASILDQATLDMVRRAAPFPKGAAAQAFNIGINYDLR